MKRRPILACVRGHSSKLAKCHDYDNSSLFCVCFRLIKMTYDWPQGQERVPFDQFTTYARFLSQMNMSSRTILYIKLSDFTLYRQTRGSGVYVAHRHHSKHRDQSRTPFISHGPCNASLRNADKRRHMAVYTAVININRPGLHARYTNIKYHTSRVITIIRVLK